MEPRAEDYQSEDSRSEASTKVTKFLSRKHKSSSPIQIDACSGKSMAVEDEEQKQNEAKTTFNDTGVGRGKNNENSSEEKTHVDLHQILTSSGPRTNLGPSNPVGCGKVQSTGSSKHS